MDLLNLLPSPLLTLAGFVVGLIIGLTAVGGGSLMTPLLVLGFGVAPATAVGTDLLYAAITKAGGVYSHDKRGTIDLRVTGLLAAGSIPAALLTAFGLQYLNAQLIGSLIKSVLGFALFLTAIAIALRHRLVAYSPVRHWQPAQVARAAVLTGALLGVMVTISSVGAGAVGVAALAFLYPSMDTRRIVGTDIAHAVPLTLIAGLAHAKLGSVDLTLLAALITGSLPGVLLGSALAVRLPERILRGALTAALLVAGVKLVS